MANVRPSLHQQGLANISSQSLAKGLKPDGEALITLRVRLHNPRRNGFHFGFRLRQALAGFEPGHAVHVRRPALRFGRIPRKRPPQFGILIQKVKAARHHADDGMRLAFDLDGFADDVGAPRKSRCHNW